ncbi:hypothetical protein K2224_18485 [Streptomyces sp. BHT-5-2]|uniref:hypothetical protein n=1 Tax=unclassified Streptomyces TaxID=2593676 RepID=UPI001C8EC0E9|nr:hypothetical protein [Streptomyces sp. BHT-5-2]QZL04885.1 hypothetical protein K2224_18485 [Streptomyces sp. BHT-5-2]
MRRIATVILGTVALFGVLATPAQASTAPITDQLVGVVGTLWGSTMPASLTYTAATNAVEASK